MMLTNNPIHTLLLLVFNAYKYLEKSILRLFTPICEWHMKNVFTRANITINGSSPQDIQVHNPKFYPWIISTPTLALGESYIEGWWDCEHIEEFFVNIFQNDLQKDYLTVVNRLINHFGYYWFNLQTKTRAFEVGQKHYDLGNDLFRSFLDPYLQYSCGYWRSATTLNQAQEDKLELIAKKLKLKPGMNVLEIGCGWGGLSQYLAEKYHVNMIGCTVSVEGAKIARERCAGLPVEIHVIDYRDIPKLHKKDGAGAAGFKYDRIVSIAMFEAVGTNNYRTFFKLANECLADDGLFLLHTIGVSHPFVPLVEPFICKYIFPNGVLPYTTQILDYSDGLFIVEDWHNFGYDYYKTLMAWNTNFKQNWPTIEKLYGPKFYRFWNYYLLMCAGVFKARKYQLWQIVMSKHGMSGGYESVR